MYTTTANANGEYALEIKLATDAGSPGGFRVIINNGEIGCQEVPHLHVHIFGGEPLGPMIARR